MAIYSLLIQMAQEQIYLYQIMTRAMRIGTVYGTPGRPSLMKGGSLRYKSLLTACNLKMTRYIIGQSTLNEIFELKMNRFYGRAGRETAQYFALLTLAI